MIIEDRRLLKGSLLIPVGAVVPDGFNAKERDDRGKSYRGGVDKQSISDSEPYSDKGWLPSKDKI